MDKLLKEANDKKGVPSHFVFEPREAADFIREIKDNQIAFRKNVEIEQTDNNDVVDIRFLLKTELNAESMHLIVNKWFKKQISISYQGVRIEVIKKKELDAPKPEFAVGKEQDGWSTPDVPTPQGPLGEEHVLQPIKTEFPILPPPPPTPPLPRVIGFDFLSGHCEECGSSLHRNWYFFGDRKGCIQKKCDNYYKKD